MAVEANRDAVYDKPMAYEDADGRIIYRASSLGSCTGALVRARLGVDGSLPSDFMQERFDEGHEWEERVLLAGLGIDYSRTVDLDYLAAYGKVVDSEAGPQVETELTWSNKAVRCHPDGIVTKVSTLQRYVCEVKFLSPDFAYDKIRAIEKDGMKGLGETYAWQASVEMLSTGLPLLYIIGMKDTGGDGSGGNGGKEANGGVRVRGIGEVYTVEFDEPCYGLKDVKARVLEVEGYVARGELPACPVPFMYPCPYWQHHEKVGPEIIEDEALRAWVDVWRRAHDAYAQATKDLDFARAAVLEQMKEIGKVSGVCDGVNITVVERGEKGNVSWSKAYKALSKQTGERVDEDEYRGEPRAGYVKIEEAKD